MKRQSDIGWFELIMGLILIILGIVIMRQPVGVVWSDSRYKWNRRHCPVCEDGTIYRFRTGRFSGDRNPWNYGGIYADRTSGSRHMGNRNDSSNLDYCTLCLQTFPSSVYENAFWNNLLLYFDDFEYSRIDRRIPAGIPANDHDFFHGSTCGCLSDP